MSISPPSPQEIEAAIKRNTTRLKRAQTAFRKNPNFANDEKVHEAQSDLNSWLSPPSYWRPVESRLNCLHLWSPMSEWWPLPDFTRWSATRGPKWTH